MKITSVSSMLLSTDHIKWC